MSDQSVGPSSGTNSKATWSLVAGILSVTICGVIAGILAIIVGKQAEAEMATSGEGGANRAKWGIILGWISVALTVLVWIIVAITFAAG